MVDCLHPLLLLDECIVEAIATIHVNQYLQHYAICVFISFFFLNIISLIWPLFDAMFNGTEY